MDPVTVFAPAKINLFLAVTGRRKDGYHDLVSVVAPLDFGDTLKFEPDGEGAFSLVSDDSELPCDDSNLILKAARLFRDRSGWAGGGRFMLQKRIPMGAGLGGGSSDAVAALKALNAAAGRPLDDGRLAELSAEIGSDCPLFFLSKPSVIRGRGERVERLPEAAGHRLSGRSLIVLKPTFAISTPWAYRTLAAAAPGSYLAVEAAEARLSGWLGDAAAPVESLLFNSFESPAFFKFPALPALLGELRERFGAAPLLSGSGSACFAFVPDEADPGAWTATIRAAWGPDVFVRKVRVA